MDPALISGWRSSADTLVIGLCSCVMRALVTLRQRRSPTDPKEINKLTTFPEEFNAGPTLGELNGVFYRERLHVVI